MDPRMELRREKEIQLREAESRMNELLEELAVMDQQPGGFEEPLRYEVKNKRD